MTTQLESLRGSGEGQTPNSPGFGHPPRKKSAAVRWVLLGVIVGVAATAGIQKVRAIQVEDVLRAWSSAPGAPVARIEGGAVELDYRHGEPARPMFILINQGDRPIEIRSIGAPIGSLIGTPRVLVRRGSADSCFNCLEGAKSFEPFRLAAGESVGIFFDGRFQGCGGQTGGAYQTISASNITYRRFGATRSTFVEYPQQLRLSAPPGSGVRAGCPELAPEAEGPPFTLNVDAAFDLPSFGLRLAGTSTREETWSQCDATVNDRFVGSVSGLARDTQVHLTPDGFKADGATWDPVAEPPRSLVVACDDSSRDRIERRFTFELPPDWQQRLATPQRQ